MATANTDKTVRNPKIQPVPKPQRGTGNANAGLLDLAAVGDDDLVDQLAGTEDEPAAGPTDESTAGPKPKLTYAQRLAAMPEDEARAIRAKANEASRISKARRKGTTPEAARVSRLEHQLARNAERQQVLEADRLTIVAALEEAQTVLATKVEATVGQA